MGEQEWEEPPNWLPGDTVTHTRLNLVSRCLRWLKQAVDGQIAVCVVRHGPEDELPPDAEPGTVYFAVDTEKLFVRGADRWCVFVPDGYR